MGMRVGSSSSYSAPISMPVSPPPPPPPPPANNNAAAAELQLNTEGPRGKSVNLNA